MKRLSAIVLAFAILFSLTACGEGSTKQSILYGKYLCYQVYYGDYPDAPDGEWIRLDPGGKGRLGISLELDMEWELDGENLTVKALGGPYHGTLKDNAIILDWGGTRMCFAPQGAITPVTDDTDLPPFTEPTEMPTEQPTEPNYLLAYVEDAVTETMNFEGMVMDYHVPMIVFDAEGIDYLNDMIYEQLYENVYEKNVIDSIEQYSMPGICAMNYQWGRAGKYLSILVSIVPYASSGTEFQIYNVDLSTGELASELEILEYFGYSTNSFHDRARNVMGSVLVEGYAAFLESAKSDPGMKAEFDDLMIRTTSDDYVLNARPFIGNDDGLWMVAPIASIAGADYYDQIIDFENYPISDSYLNFTIG